MQPVELCSSSLACRYAEDKKRAREQYEAIGKLLDAQVASNQQRNAQEAALQQQQIDVLKAKWAADDEAARQAEVAARAKQQQLNLEVKEFNRSVRCCHLMGNFLYVGCFCQGTEQIMPAMPMPPCKHSSVVELEVSCSVSNIMLVHLLHACHACHMQHAVSALLHVSDPLPPSHLPPSPIL